MKSYKEMSKEELLEQKAELLAVELLQVGQRHGTDQEQRVDAVDGGRQEKIGEERSVGLRPLCGNENFAEETRHEVLMPLIEFRSFLLARCFGL